LFEGEMGDVCPLAGVLDGNSTNVTGLVEVQNRILVEVSTLRDFGRLELDVECVGLLEVANFHSSNDRSKKALCTVSPSRKQYNAQIPLVHFCDENPATDSAILLNHFPSGIRHGALNPLQTNGSSVGTLSHRFEISREPHRLTLVTFCGAASLEENLNVSEERPYG
jgi:hypothetical protein